MNGTTKKTKLCWNCDGEVERSAENCIYCGVYLHPEEESNNDSYDEVDVTPPYEIPEEEESTSYEPVYESSRSPSPSESMAVVVEAPSSSDAKGVIFPMMFLLTGSAFLFFSLLLYFFAKDGILVLRWNATYWFVYALFSIPLLYIGWRTLQYLDENHLD